MDIHFTARKFRARKNVKDHAIEAVKKLDRYYDGIVRGTIVLSFERMAKSVKSAEITLHVYGTVLTGRERSEDFLKSVDLAVDKLERQLEKYKTKLHTKNKKTLRRVKEEIAEPVGEEDE